MTIRQFINFVGLPFPIFCSLKRIIRRVPVLFSCRIIVPDKKFWTWPIGLSNTTIRTDWKGAHGRTELLWIKSCVPGRKIPDRWSFFTIRRWKMKLKESSQKFGNCGEDIQRFPGMISVFSFAPTDRLIRSWRRWRAQKFLISFWLYAASTPSPLFLIFWLVCVPEKI